MNKYIFSDNIYEDFDLYHNIRKQYNITDEIILHNIYLLKIDINKENNYINNINININTIKNKFLIDTKKWTLEDSCNKKKLNLKIKNILEIHDSISQLNYQKKDHLINIEKFNNTINNIIYNNSTNNNNNNNNIFINTEEDDINLIING